MQTLYRKYRPQDFNEVFGQEAIVKVLRSQVRDDRLGHAYLFTGPRGTGKTSMARLIVKAVNCRKVKNGNPCKKCNSCVAIEKGRFLDLIEIDAASNRGIDEIRRLKERVNFSPSEGKYKVYIIDEVHMLTKDAFNALLKTLEEPPGHVIFILATTEAHKIPSTILSRCQRFNFTLAKDEVVLDRLKYICKQEGVNFSEDALIAIVKNAGGSFRDSESILEKVLGVMGVKKDKRVDFVDVKDILGLAEDKEVRVFIEKLFEKDANSSLKIFDKIVSSGVNLFQFLRQTLEYSRELLIQKVSKKKGSFALVDLLKIITELSEAEGKLKFTQVKRLPIEVAIVKVCFNDEAKERGNSSKEVQQVLKKKIPTLVSEAISEIPKKIKTSFKEKKDKGKNKDEAVNLERVVEEWKVITEKIRPYNHHLSAFFKKARPVDIKGVNLTLNVPFRFHKQRIESLRAQRIFSKVSKATVGVELSCMCEVVEEDHLEKVENNEVVSSNNNVVLEVLGDMIE